MSSIENAWTILLNMPTLPNPTSVCGVMVDESKIVGLVMSFEEASNFVISVGVDFSKLEDVAAKLLSNKTQ
ncbi:DUF502 domain-containing protein [Methylomonas lenta]|uniref:hypothetical protein n=1 Tax=Methylomonas lenta TaxID=980561 RepID=UPI00082D6718|nr:hypothetical protein [Methylomonas lenta]